VYWFLEGDPASLSKNSGIITEWLLLLLAEQSVTIFNGDGGEHSQTENVV
jgi:hypothetical protein